MSDTATQPKNNSKTGSKMKTPTSPRINSKKCGMGCEVYARVTGYMRPINNWNRGKLEEFQMRKVYSV